PTPARDPLVTSALRYNNDVSCDELYVLLEIPAANDVGIAKRRRRLLLALASQDDDVVRSGERRHTSRHAERLHDVHARIDDELDGLVHLTEHVTLVAVDLLYWDRHDGIGDVLAQAVAHDLVELHDRPAARIDLPDERKRKRAIGTHQHLSL